MGSFTEAESADLPAGTVAALGVPFDAHSSYLRGAAGAPRAIRRLMASGASNWCAENGMDLSAEPRFRDVGDVALTDDLSANQQIYDGVYQLLKRGARILALGGDHAITYPIVKAHAAIHGPLMGADIVELNPDRDLVDITAMTAAKLMKEIAAQIIRCKADQEWQNR